MRACCADELYVAAMSPSGALVVDLSGELHRVLKPKHRGVNLYHNYPAGLTKGEVAEVHRIVSPIAVLDSTDLVLRSAEAVRRIDTEVFAAVSAELKKFVATPPKTWKPTTAVVLPRCHVRRVLYYFEAVAWLDLIWPSKP